MKIRCARSEDLDGIKALLAEDQLPVAEVTDDMLHDFAVTEDACVKLRLVEDSGTGAQNVPTHRGLLPVA